MLVVSAFDQFGPAETTRLNESIRPTKQVGSAPYTLALKPNRPGSVYSAASSAGRQKILNLPLSSPPPLAPLRNRLS